MKLTPITVRETNLFRAGEAEIISVEQQGAALNSLCRGDVPFTRKDLTTALRKQGVKDAAYRGTYRLLQKLRKQGVIQFAAGYWTWVRA